MDNAEDSIFGLISKIEWLENELNHRVRNILQVVLSLLNTQLFFLEDEKMVKVITEIHLRFYAIALVYGQLPQGDYSGRVQMRRTVGLLLDHLWESLRADAFVRLVNDVEDITLPLNEAVVVGVILNEVVSDAIQRVLESSRLVTIGVSLRLTEEGRVRLVVSDDGEGQSFLASQRADNCFAAELIKGLVRDLDATLVVEYNSGPLLIIEFNKSF